MSKFVFKQVIALQLGKGLGPSTLAIAQYLGDHNPGVVVQNRLRHATEKREGGKMAVQKGFRVFGRISETIFLRKNGPGSSA